jgi:dTDP-4-dehydrorhamnose 3,5-epimerase
LIKSLGIDGSWLFEPDIKQDDRGYFLEWYRAAEFNGALGYNLEVAQANCSVSRRGVIRGVHFAAVPPGQAKYVTCVAGAVFDVTVDLRVGSPTFGQWVSVQLDEEQRLAVFLQEGLGHGFMALSETATVMYLCSTPYTPSIEHGIHPLDPDLRVDWPLDADMILSGKDAAAPALAEARSSGLLPEYAACLDYGGKLRDMS